MAGTELTVDLRDLEPLETKLKSLSSGNLLELLQGVGAEIERQTRRRIQDEKTAPDGTPWVPWSENYAGSHHGRYQNHDPHRGELRQSEGHSLLELSGDLLNSLMYEASLDSVEVTAGANLRYAATHQYGDANRHIPARPYMGLSDSNVTDLENLASDFLERVFS